MPDQLGGSFNPTLDMGITGNIGATGSILSSGTLGVGYAAGAGGVVTQLTSKSTAVTLNKLSGLVTMNNAQLNDATNVSFTVTNSTVGATDSVIVNHASGGTAGAYQVFANAIAAGSFAVTVRNASGGNLTEAIVLRYVVIKAVSA